MTVVSDKPVANTALRRNVVALVVLIVVAAGVSAAGWVWSNNHHPGGGDWTDSYFDDAGEGASKLKYTAAQLSPGQTRFQRKIVYRDMTDRGWTYTATEMVIETISQDATTVTRESVDFPPEFTDRSQEAAWERAGKPSIAGFRSERKRVEPLSVQVGDRVIPLDEANKKLGGNASQVGAMFDDVTPGPDETDDDARFAAAARILVNPAVSAKAREGIYGYLATIPGTELVGGEPAPGQVGKQITVARESGFQLTFAESTGQVVELSESDGTYTTIDQAGVFNCVEPQGPSGPKTLYAGCATGAYMITGLAWDNWGDTVARGRGVAEVNNCDPSCAEGKKHKYPVTVEMSEQQDCGYRLLLYSTMTVKYKDKVPAGTPRQESFQFDCKPG